ncbi:uncharacterized protein LOC117186435 [Drosophila miranda]|uniref:uncharacterized protein LOC117186435 n=1 Tax=Drosophila miranda TaxID=7229 RepID=UPI00143F5FAB|nr:uncharacterized protein LOC117186435 [Drosophila miranda]
MSRALACTGGRHTTASCVPANDGLRLLMALVSTLGASIDAAIAAAMSSFSTRLSRSLTSTQSSSDTALMPVCSPSAALISSLSLAVLLLLAPLSSSSSSPFAVLRILLTLSPTS